MPLTNALINFLATKLHLTPQHPSTTKLSLVCLKRSDFDTILTYTTDRDPNAYANDRHQRNRQRNVIWYNPPYSRNVKTNVAQNFLQLIDKHFPTTNKLYKIFNWHTVRVSYGCLENMKTYITKHNKRILNKHATQTNANKNDTRQTVNNETQQCNCRQRDACPVEGKCLSASLVYQADVTTADNGETKSYVGVTGGEFKGRYRNHVKSFKSKKYSNNTELSKHVWKLKESRRAFSIKWSLVKKVPTYKAGSRRCNLCLEEKLFILKNRKNLLNKRTEIFSKCRHETRYLINKFQCK